MVKNKEKTKKSRIKQYIGYCLSILCVLLCLYITVEVINANTHNRPPSIFGVSTSYVPTESMEPTIKAKSYVVFTKVNYKDIKENDIIVYYSRANQKFIIHRVIEINADGSLTLKGDNNEIADTESVTKDMVYGRYVMTLGLLSTILSGGVNKNLIFFILVIIFAGMLAMQVISIVIKKKTDELKEKEKNERAKMLEELKKEVLAEELAKMRAELENEVKPQNESLEENTKKDDE